MRIKFILLFLFFLFVENYIFAQNMESPSKYPDFAYEYLGYDRFENFNRKMFLLNGAINKYAIRPITVIWSSVMPKYGMDRIKYAYNNILYPRQLVSSICQGDFKGAVHASARFIVNSTVGLGGMFDPAKRFLKINPVNEDMEQALAKWKIKQGPYLVVPILSSSTPRGLIGRAFDAALDPSSYVGSPVIAAVKAGFTVNNFTMLQPLSKVVENNYIDPYDITKKLYGLQIAILNSNLDRTDVLNSQDEIINDTKKDIMEDITKEDSIINVSDEIKIQTVKDSIQIVAPEEVIKGGTSTDEIIYDDILKPDIILKNFNPQNPVIDSMRTALFDVEGVDNSIWGDMSLWNRSFQNRIKTSSISIEPDREKYKYRYIMQKDKNSPLAIIFPSVGESIYSHHSDLFAKLFYDEGYSVLIQGSAFHYDFVKSMEKSFKPGIPKEDVKHIKTATLKIVNELENKYNCKFSNKVVLGTSYGAMSTLFLAANESDENMLNISKYISINPPIELLYALNQIDANSEEWIKDSDNLKDKTALTAAKILQTANKKEEENIKIETLPFNEKEAKLITGFVLHQKLSDLLFAIEEIPPSKKTDFYERVKNTNYKDYAQKYLVTNENPTIEDFSNSASLHSIKNYLQNNSNYTIYHSLDDYLVNENQLRQLKNYAKKNMKLIDKGAHLGFLYREEFIDDLKKEINLKQKARL